MTIEGKRSEDPSHQENLFYDVLCYTCPKISEEDGDYLPGPAEIVGFQKQATWTVAMDAASEHEKTYGLSHQIRIREFDTGKIQDALDED